MYILNTEYFGQMTPTADTFESLAAEAHHYEGFKQQFLGKVAVAGECKFDPSSISVSLVFNHVSHHHHHHHHWKRPLVRA